MAKISPFLSDPKEWVEKLAVLREDRKKIEEAEKKYREKLLEYLKNQQLVRLDGAKHSIILERRERADFSQESLKELFGEEWLAEARSKLPVVMTESLRLVDTKASDRVQSEEKRDRISEIKSFFGGKRHAQ